MIWPIVRAMLSAKLGERMEKSSPWGMNWFRIILCGGALIFVGGELVGLWGPRSIPRHDLLVDLFLLCFFSANLIYSVWKLRQPKS